MLHLHLPGGISGKYDIEAISIWPADAKPGDLFMFDPKYFQPTGDCPALSMNTYLVSSTGFNEDDGLWLILKNF